MQGGVDSVARFMTVNEQSETNTDCSFRSSLAYFASGRSYHRNVFEQFAKFGPALVDVTIVQRVTSKLVCPNATDC